MPFPAPVPLPALPPLNPPPQLSVPKLLPQSPAPPTKSSGSECTVPAPLLLGLKSMSWKLSAPAPGSGSGLESGSGFSAGLGSTGPSSGTGSCFFGSGDDRPSTSPNEPTFAVYTSGGTAIWRCVSGELRIQASSLDPIESALARLGRGVSEAGVRGGVTHCTLDTEATTHISRSHVPAPKPSQPLASARVTLSTCPQTFLLAHAKSPHRRGHSTNPSGACILSFRTSFQQMSPSPRLSNTGSTRLRTSETGCFPVGPPKLWPTGAVIIDPLCSACMSSSNSIHPSRHTTLGVVSSSRVWLFGAASSMVVSNAEWCWCTDGPVG